jgi:hypothetical protein
VSIERLLEIFLEADGPVCIQDLIDEASVHRPRRGSLWVASYRDETGKQVWVRTGEHDRAAAQAVADKLEAEARRKRETQGPIPKKPTIRVRPGSVEKALGLLSQAEVAAIMRLSERTVRKIERDAFQKLRDHPKLRAFWREYFSGDVEESTLEPSAGSDLTEVEVAALFGLAKTPLEWRALKKLIQATGRVFGH